jgi:pimeloyl-ACP methyl ester carboxylesterase
MPTPVIVFLPGILGSVLKLNEKVVWPGSIFHLHGPYPNLNELTDPNLVATDVIRSVCVSKQYVALIDTLAECGFTEGKPDGSGRRLVLCPYDWRKSNANSAKTLDQCIQKIVVATPDAQITLLAHSMGGLVSRYYLESTDFSGSAGFDKVTTLIMLATPNSGAPAALGSVLGQRDTVFLTRDQTRQLCANPDYTGPYELLPRAEAPFLWDGAAGEALRLIKLYDSATVNALGLSPKNIAAAQAFHARLSLDRKPASVRYFTFVGTHFQTISADLFLASGPSASLTTVEPQDSGDGTVPIWSAQLPGIQQTQVDGAHETIYQDSGLIQYLKQLLGVAPLEMALSTASSSSSLPPVQLQVRDQIVRSGGNIHISLTLPSSRSPLFQKGIEIDAVAMPPAPVIASDAETRVEVVSRGDQVQITLTLPHRTPSSGPASMISSSLLGVPSSALSGDEIRLEPMIFSDAGEAMGFGQAVLRFPVQSPNGRVPRQYVVIAAPAAGVYRIGYYRPGASKPVSSAFVSVG